MDEIGIGREVAYSRELAGEGSTAGSANEGDALSEVLYALRLTGAGFLLVNAAPRWTAAAPPGHTLGSVMMLHGARQVISCHRVLAGDCWCALPGGPSAHLQAGDVAVIPHGDPYVLSSTATEYGASPVANHVPLFARGADGALPCVMRQGGAGHPCVQIACGFLGHDAWPSNPMLAALPRLLQMGVSDTPAAGRVGGLLDFALSESGERRAGRDCVLRRLGELLWVELIRSHVSALPSEQTGWLAGLRDPIVGRALATLHEHPAYPWTLAGLAKRAGVSRSTLAARFAHFVGQPPMQYLTRWRVQLAARMLGDGARKMSAVARSVGYGSEAAFSRAFKKAAGVSPSIWRDEQVRAGAHR